MKMNCQPPGASATDARIQLRIISHYLQANFLFTKHISIYPLLLSKGFQFFFHTGSR